MKKRLLAMLLALVMLVPLVPAFELPVQAEESYLWPVPNSRKLNQGYSSGHLGIDIGGICGVDAVVATKSGTVCKVYYGCKNLNAKRTRVSCSASTGCSCRGSFKKNGIDVCNWGYGNGVVIDHGDGTYSSYAHLDSVSVSLNQEVDQGQQIGILGSCGWSSGPHLHFSVSNGISAKEKGTLYLDNTGYVGLQDYPINVESLDYIYSASPTPTSTHTELANCIYFDDYGFDGAKGEVFTHLKYNSYAAGMVETVGVDVGYSKGSVTYLNQDPNTNGWPDGKRFYYSLSKYNFSFPANSTFYYQFYAHTASGDEAKSGMMFNCFTGIPTVSNVTSSSAKVSIQIDKNAPVNEIGLDVGTSESNVIYYTHNDYSSSCPSSNTLSFNINNLQAGKTYYVRYYAKMDGCVPAHSNIVSFTTSAATHTHSYTTVYYEAAHPHYNCYQCSCGDVQRRTSETNYVASCEICNPSSFTISYNANGGYSAPDVQTKIKDVDLVLSSKTPSKKITLTYDANGGSVAYGAREESLSFMGWNTSADGTGTYYSSGGTYSANTSATLYAQWWSKKPQYLATPTRSGCTFVGWYTTPTGGTKITTSTAVSQSMTIYAVWDAAITYDPNGGTISQTSQTFRCGGSNKFITETPVRAGYRFTGWKDTYNGYSYAPADSIPTSWGSNTLVAQWTPYVLTMNYNVNGGSINSNRFYVNNSLVYLVDGSKLLNDQRGYGYVDSEYGLYDAATFGLTREGYTFVGWSLSADGSTTIYDQADNTILTQTICPDLATGDRSVVFYAIWEKDLVTHTVTLIPNGGNVDGALTYQVTDGDKFYLPAISKTFTQTFDPNGGTLSDNTKEVDMTFLGWSIVEDGTGTLYKSYRTIKEDTTFYAQWDNGVLGTTPTPTRTGYVFVGWNTKGDGSGIFVGEDRSISKKNTFYAQWTVKTYTVKYDVNGGTGEFPDQTKTHGEPLTLATARPTREGYTFTKWNTKADGTGTPYNPGGATYSANADVTLYAQWKENTSGSYTVTYNANGGGGAPAAQTKSAGETITLTSDVPWKSYHVYFIEGATILDNAKAAVFLGWNTAQDGSGTSFAPGASYGLDADQTLYAQWQAPLAGNLANQQPQKPQQNMEFGGWETRDGVLLTETTVLTSHWSVVPIWNSPSVTTYTITYNANGGTGAPEAQTKTKGVDLVLSEEMPTRTYLVTLDPANGTAVQTFNSVTSASHWNTAADGSGTHYGLGSVFTEDADTTLYAEWENGKMLLTVLSGDLPVPEREGYTFVGWFDESGNAVNDETLLIKKDLYCTARWQKNEDPVVPPTPVDPDAPQIVVESKSVSSGKEFTVTVEVKNNPGVMAMTLIPEFSEDLSLVKAENGNLLSEMTASKNYFLTADDDVTEDGILLTLTFTTAEDLEPGDYAIGFRLWDSSDSEENDVPFVIVPGVITVTDTVWGDANGDGVVNNKDIVRLKNYFANYNDITNTSTVEIFPGADANGDGVVNNKDIVRLKKYFADYDDITGASTVILGPAV